MKRAVIFLTIFMIIITICLCFFDSKVYATEGNGSNNATTNEINHPNGNLVELKEKQVKTLEEYKEKYGSDSYGLTAYVLHVVQIYSIPFCFLGIVISLIYKLVLGKRHMESMEKGLGMIVAVVTITIICQVLPLVFALVVKLGRE